MVTQDTNVPCDEETSYVDEIYFDDNKGYSSCYAVSDSVKTEDKWMVDSSYTDHLSPYLNDFVSKKDCTRNCMTANREIIPIYGPGVILLKHNNEEHNNNSWYISRNFGMILENGL